MSADFNDIIREGFGRMKSKHLNSWNKRWLVLRMSSSKGPRRIEKYANDKKAQLQGNEPKVIAIFDNIQEISRLPGDVKKYGVLLRLSDSTERQLAFDEENECNDWVIDMRDLHKRRDSFTSQIDELFSVYLLPSPNLSIFGECLLQVAKEHIILYDVNDRKKQLVSWPVTALRRYKKLDEKLFMIEAGNKCSTGEGIFTFTTTKAERINSKVQKASKAIVVAFKVAKGNANGDDRAPFSRSLSDSPIPDSAHTPVHHSRSFPTSMSNSRPPAPPPRDPVTRSPSGGTTTSQNTTPRSSNGSINHDLPPAHPPPLPPMRPGNYPSASAAAATATAGARSNTNNNNDDIYEEKYLEPTFKTYLSQRK